VALTEGGSESAIDTRKEGGTCSEEVCGLEGREGSAGKSGEEGLRRH
jgi:hypothetical protein